jgi:hypothetical protein
MPMRRVNAWVREHHKSLELVGVSMRIASFGTVSWLGKDSPFLIVWTVNTADALLLSWCSWVRKDLAYTILNVFWILVGAVGLARALGWI